MQTFVLSHFNFCPTVWHFCKSCDTLKIEKVQYRAVKCFDDFKCSYDILRRRAYVTLLYTRRRKTVLLEVYKANHSYDPQYLSEMFKKQKDHTRNSKAHVQHKCNTTTNGLYIVLSMKERWRGISWICLLEMTVVCSTSKIFKWYGI